MANAAPTKRWPIGVAAEAFVWMFVSFLAVFAAVLVTFPLFSILFRGVDPRVAIDPPEGLMQDLGPLFMTAVIMAATAGIATLIALSRPQWFAATYRDPPSVQWDVVAICIGLLVAGPLSIAWVISQIFHLNLHGDLGNFLTSYGAAVNAAASRVEPAINTLLTSIDPQRALQPNWAHGTLGLVAGFIAPLILTFEISSFARGRINLMSLWWFWVLAIMFLAFDATRRPAGLFLVYVSVFWLLPLTRTILTVFWPKPSRRPTSPALAIFADVMMGAPFIAAAAILLASGAFSAWRP